ncbi:RNA polymerase sigma factor [Rhodopirellula sp. SWK7]|uniref:RNA polymerase sigma factor n=1 Tax=Rhodopirellula sp. SWK7 TaxID=595460 RepID=UPI000A011D9D|nr:sigma-70 family RNA polymerase sigma factor [Rhodopirellula sp. SWK7]
MTCPNPKPNPSQPSLTIEAKSRYATSLGLLQNLKAGEDQGWRQFVHLYTPLIYVWCRKAGLQESDSADVCQEVFRAVSSGINGFHYENPSHSFRGWLWTITRHSLSKHFGREEKSPKAAGGTDAIARLSQVPDWIDDDEFPEAESAESEVIRRAAELIRGDFNEKTWQAFWMSAVEEIPASEIAERLGMTNNGVRQAKFRVVARLKEFVGFL